MSRRRQLLRGNQGPQAGYRYWRFSKTDVNGDLNVQPFSQVSDFKLYLQYDQAGSSLPNPLLTSNTSNPNFIITPFPTTLANPAREFYMAFDNSTSSFWQPTNYSSWYITIDFNRNRLIKSFYMKKYDFNEGQHIKIEVSDTGLFNGEEVILDITHPNANRSYSELFWNILGEEFPSRPTNITKISSTINSLSLSCSASTSLNSTIASYDWYVDDVYHSTTASTSVTITGLDSATMYKISVIAEDADGLRSNPSQYADIETDLVGIVYTQGAGSGSYTHYRFQAVDELGANTSNPSSVLRIKLFTGINETGTEYPTTNLTSATSESGITISSGHYYSETYADWRAFNPSGAWWTLSGAANDNWIQIEFDTAKTIESIYIQPWGNFHTAKGYKILGSNTGAFGGEEVLIGELQNIREGENTVPDLTQNL